MNSNKQKGEGFTGRVHDYLKSDGQSVSREYAVEVGLNSLHKKNHRFDLGNESLLVECKAYDWTESGRIPSAKLATANEAMVYFFTASEAFRKMMFFAETERKGKRNLETLGEYYVRQYLHMIPEDVEVWELDSAGVTARQIWPGPSTPRSIVEQRHTPERISHEEEQNESDKGTDTQPVMYLRLEKITYYKGYFNVPVAFSSYVRKEEGDVTLVLGGKSAIRGRVDRTAQSFTKAPRIYGNKPLWDWIQKNYSLYDTIPVCFNSQLQLTLG